MDLGGIHYLEVEVHMDLEDVTESSVMWLGASLGALQEVVDH